MRLLSLLEAIASEPDGMTLSELSDALSVAKSTLLTMLRPMSESGHLERRDQRYLIGWRSFHLANEILQVRQLSGTVRGLMRELWVQTQETVILVGIDRDAQLATYLECIDSPQHVRYVVPMGTVRPLYASAGGLALLAFQPSRWRESYIRTASIKKLTPTTLNTKRALRERIEVIRERGASISESEMVAGAMGIAVPVWTDEDDVRHALLIAGPVERMRRERETITTRLVETARRASGSVQSG